MCIIPLMQRQKPIRKTDVHRLNKWLEERGPSGMAALYETGISIHTIDRLLKGQYEHAPRGATRKALISATGLSLDELFPLAKAGRAS